MTYMLLLNCALKLVEEIILYYDAWSKKHKKNISIRTKFRIFRSNVKSVLLYGSETWKVAKTTSSKLQVFVNRCLRRILNIHWPEVISNEELWRRAEETEISLQIKRRKWNWIRHTLRKGHDIIERFWIATHRDNGKEGGLNRRGGDRSTTRH